jgi:subtilisin family serine protease
MANHEHLRWQRLKDETKTPTRKGFGSKPPFRPQQAEHGDNLLRKLKVIQQEAEQAQKAMGINPSYLRILQFSFLEGGDEEQRKWLEVNFGAYLIEQQDIRLPIEPPYFSIPVNVQNPETTKRLLGAGTLTEFGIVDVESVRSSATGQANPSQVALKFLDQEAAKLFLANQEIHTRFGMTLAAKQLSTHKIQTVHRFLVQFPDAETMQHFEDELAAYQSLEMSALGTGGLTSTQRFKLFDSLENIDFINAEDRKGQRLIAEGIPETPEFYLDVDLWHPDPESPELKGQIIREFNTFVSENGGTVTDSLSGVAETLLIARIRANVALLEALLNYIQVARVDLPPQLEPSTWSIYDEIPLPEEQDSELGAEAPLACVIDSGIVSNHPLLRGAVLDERDFDSGEGTVADRHGHGTHVAGIVVLGDIPKCISERQWEPKVRLLSAKVLHRIAQAGFNDPQYVRSAFADEKRAESQLRDAITFYAQEYGCRVFNLSLGNDSSVYDPNHRFGRQLPWGLLLDELARKLDVVLVISAGNAKIDPPQVHRSDEFQGAVRDLLLSNTNPIIDPAYAALGLTVGSIAREDIPFLALAPGQQPQRRSTLVASPANSPSPFTRTGHITSSGSGLQRIIKPELVGYGGNYAVNTFGTGWDIKDLRLAEPSLNFNFQGTRLLSMMCGTSQAAPYVTHVAALVEAQLRQRGVKFSANLIRALTVHSASVPQKTQEWLGLNQGYSPTDAELRQLRSMGYGLPDPIRACYSQDNRAVLTTEDSVGEGNYHLYELEIPDTFLELEGRRKIKVTLVYNPPTRGTRKEHIGRTMWFQLYRRTTETQIRQAMGNQPGSSPTALKSYEVKSRPTSQTLEWSTVQSALFESPTAKPFAKKANSSQPADWHIIVACNQRFPSPEEEPRQKYALVVSLEHEDSRVRLYQSISQRISQRVRV